VLSALLSQLQSYFNKYFVVGSFSPMLAFTFINGGVAYFIFDPWRVWADDNILKPSLTSGTFLVASFVIAIVLAAYVLSSLSTFLRRQLEGEWWDFVAAWFIPAQNKGRLALAGERDQAFREIPDLARMDYWEKELRDARTSGTIKYEEKEFKLSPDDDDEIETKLGELETKRKNHTIVTAADLTKVAELLRLRLQMHNVNRGKTLEQEHRRLVVLIDYATDLFAGDARGRNTRLQNELNSNFGAQDIAPTKMGNIANTIQSYVMRRYRCNLEILWTNLMQIVQKDEKAQAMLMESKTQLDFLVACCWLTLLTGIIWSVIAFAIAPTRWGFRLAALGGPLGAYLWYRAAAEQYRSFADVAMTLFDSFRLDLLRAMRLQTPADVADERTTWAAVDRLMTFGDEENFRYDKPGPQAPS
jgi:hypothetical protein